ncbi:arylsulfatase [Aquirufa nivalisilvae]|uniref:arylsulfatase n=1 Tax=Aquirufa nivalisilvae TaxID=2516557 RepID=UPI0022A97AB0|nr:arylsulfatase [Aquirufa nivalisilvae]MCZ2483163.1 arylsulfatase [Aquirufa nivalisilvae]
MKKLFTFCLLFLALQPILSIPKTRPNVIIILVDDMGFSDIGIFGSEIKTPNIDLMGKKGAVFTQFYNAGRCCPSRASLLTGMYPHQAGMGGMVITGDYDRTKTGAYQGFLNVNTPTIAEELKKNGYATYMSGKWHMGEKRPDWPNQRGFDHFYGLISGANSYYELLPKRQLIEDNEPFSPQGNYYFTDAISDKSVSYLQKNKSTGKPFFLYVAYTAPHWPIHAPQDLIDSYKSRYTQGWEALRKQRFEQQKKLGLDFSHGTLPASDPNLISFENEADKASWIEKMATYAAMVDKMDQGIGKIIQELKANGTFDNTVIFFLSDNGACHEVLDDRSSQDLGPEKYKASLNTKIGAPGSYTTYGKEWAYASNTPFRMYKHWMHEGGISTPLVISYPNEIKKNIQSHQVGHIMDIFPTIMELTHTKTTKVVEGKSLVPILKQRKRDAQSFIAWEHLGNRAIREGDWKLVWDNEIKAWELYNVRKDRIESHNLIKSNPDKFNDLLAKYTEWAIIMQVK